MPSAMEKSVSKMMNVLIKNAGKEDVVHRHIAHNALNTVHVKNVVMITNSTYLKYAFRKIPINTSHARVLIEWQRVDFVLTHHQK